MYRPGAASPTSLGRRSPYVTAGLLLVAFGVLLATNRITRLAGALINFLDAIGLDFLTEI